MNKINIGYFADGPWSHRAIEKLLDDQTISIAFICARNDVPDPILKSIAKEMSIIFLTHSNINSDEFVKLINSFGCDLLVSMSFNQIFRERLIHLPRLGLINCHAGMLPYYRGRNILNWALINDEKEFGITVHYVDSGIDTGDIIVQHIHSITDDDNYATLLERAYHGCAIALFESIKKLQVGDASRVRQSTIHPLGFYCSARKEGDELLDWHQSSRDIFNFVRAICRPGPESRSFIGDVEVRINRVQWLPNAPVYKGIPGVVVGLDEKSFHVKTLDSYVKVIEWDCEESIRIGDRLF